MPAGSKMDSPLTKAELISNSSSASVITFKKGKKLLCNSSWKRGVRICERNNCADTKVSEEGGGGGAPGTGAEIPLQPVEKAMVRQAVPLQPMEDDGMMMEQIFPCSPWRTPRWSRWRHLKEAGTPWEAHAGAGSWQDLWREEPMPGQVCWQDL
ncbi:epimerase family protein SDR39U1 [Grus japonensis]|uniref:Epimerase family protein SDR39U1 n=1 Tax=Grus japonensis TaxID=30415 RepID=A0ABC9YFU2_GRUJA